METDGYVVMEGGQVKLVEQSHVAVEIVSDFIGHNREHLARGERVSLPRALARAQIAIGAARELTAEELSAAAPTPPEVVEVRDPTPTNRDPKMRKR